MQTRIARFVPILVASLLACALAGGQEIEKPPHVEVDGNIEWVYDYGQGQLMSHSTGKPMFVVFRCER